MTPTDAEGGQEGVLVVGGACPTGCPGVVVRIDTRMLLGCTICGSLYRDLAAPFIDALFAAIPPDQDLVIRRSDRAVMGLGLNEEDAAWIERQRDGELSA